MRAVICGGIRHASIYACAEWHGVASNEVEDAVYVTGKLQGMRIAFEALKPVEERNCGPLLGRGYCTHRLGTYHGGRH